MERNHVIMSNPSLSRRVLLGGLAAFLVPTPAAWLVVGAAWTAIGLWQVVVSRQGDASHPLAG